MLSQEVLATTVPAVIAAIVSLITLFLNKNSNKVLEKVEKLEERQEKFENKFEYEMACQARTRILRFNNELMCGANYTKEYFEDIIQNSIDVYENYYNDPNHKKLKNGIAKSAVKNIMRIYTRKIETNTFLTYPKEVNTNEGNSDHAGSAAC